MANLNFELYLENMDWNSDDFKTEVTHLKTYNQQNVLVNEETIDRLHIEIIHAKGDWMNFNTNVVGDNYYIQANLIFNSTDLSEDNKQIIKNVIKKCESFFEDMQLTTTTTTTTTNNNFELLNEDGFLIKAHEEGGGRILQDLKQVFSSQDISFKIIRHQQSRFDGGASGGFEEVLLFVASSIASGITWDVLKGMLINKLEPKFESIKSTFMDNKEFKKLRKNIAEIIIEDPRDLVLNEFYKQENELICEFKIYGITEKTITVLCDLEYRIKEFKQERK